MHRHLHHPLKASILAVGTEITAGEILNSNAATLAAHLTEFGYVCDLHLTVPDDRDLMAWAITHAMAEHGLVIITGGLGPTTDDFTRDVIGLVANRKPVWDESSWAAIVTRLNSLNAPTAKSNRQQAFFPEGSTIYPNNHGTAAAFSLQCQHSLIVALPGPPNEIAGLWDDSIRGLIAGMAPNEKNQTPKRWRCLGQSESKLGELVEAALQGSGLMTGYRSHVPYIDIKVWVSEHQVANFESLWRSKLETAISPWLIGRDGDDLVEQFRQSCPIGAPIYILDRATSGYLAQRIFARSLPAGCQLSVISADDGTPMPQTSSSSEIATVTANIATGEWQLALTGNGPHRSFHEQSRFRGTQHAPRLKAYIGEKVLLCLRDWFAES